MFASRKELFQGATSASSICGSALMWSWWDLAFYSGIFLNWTPGGQDLIVPSFVVGMLTSGGALLLMAFLAQQISPILYRGRLRQLVVGAVAGIASVGCVGAAWLHSLPLALICSSINGVCLAVMLALWGTLWSERGASSSIIVTSLAIPLGIAIDGMLIFALRPLAAIFVMALFPLASIVVYLFAARPLVDNATYTRARLTKATSIGPLDNRFRFEIFGVSLLLLVGLTVGECAFNFMNFHFAYDGMTPDQSLSFNYPYHVARALGALSCFIFVGLLRIPYKRFFWIGIMTMCGAFAIAPFLEALGLPAYFSNYVNQACFAIVAIFEVAVFCEISYARQTYPLESVGFGMVFITGFIVPGLLLGMFTASLHLTNSQYEMLTAVAGYAVILGLWAAVSEGQRYLDPQTGVAAGSRLKNALEHQQEERRRERYDTLVETAALTQRERAVLDELLRERSALAIADKLSIAENTVRTHVQNIYKKLGVHSREELTALFEPMEGTTAICAGIFSGKGALPMEESDTPLAGKRRSMNEAISSLAQAHGLTLREQEVFALLARGYRHKEIARKLVVSSSTVHTHVTNVYAKLNVHSQDELSELVKDLRDQSPEV